MVEINVKEEREMWTRHSLKRAKERAGYNEKVAKKKIALAYKRGIHAKDCHDSIDRKYLIGKSSQGIEAIAFDGMCYLFSVIEGKCLTLYKLPNDFGRRKMYYNKEVVRDIRKYRWLKNNFEMAECV